MANILSSLLAGLVQQDAPTDVEGITVSPTKKMMPAQAAAPPPPQPAQNPFSPDYIQAAQQAQQSQQQLPRVSGGTDAGLFGFLPKGLQQGRLRDILGAIGDGILVEGGHDAIYQPRKEARQMGQALIGYDQDPQQALLRLAQTGAPDSVKMAQQGIQNLETREQKAVQQEQLNNYREQQISLKRYQAAQQLQPYLRSIMSTVKDEDSYAKAWDRISQMMTRMGIKADATEVFGLPGPNDYEEGMLENLGLKASDILRGDTTREGIAQRDQANVRTTQTSAANNARTTQTSASNNARTTETSRRNTDVRAAAAKPAARKPAVTAKPTAKPTGTTKPAGSGPTKPTQAMVQAYQGGTPSQRAQARAIWRTQGYDVRNLK